MTNALTTYNNVPWVGAGKQGSWSSVKEAMQVCELDFNVDLFDPKYSYEQDGLNFYETVPGYGVTVRTDTNKSLGIVSDTYKLIQNEEVFSMLEPFIEFGGTIKAGGMTDQGLCFMVLTVEDIEAGGDSFNINVMATNSFNGRYPAAIICTPVRIICQNMYRKLMANKDNVMSFRHSINAPKRIMTLKESFQEFLTDYETLFTKNIEILKLSKAKHSIDEFVELMYPYNDKVAPGTDREKNSKELTDQKRHEYINRYYNSPTNSDFGTCFALVNAYYDYITHNEPVRKSEQEYFHSRFSSLVAGTSVKTNLMKFMKESI